MKLELTNEDAALLRSSLEIARQAWEKDARDIPDKMHPIARTSLYHQFTDLARRASDFVERLDNL
jgi:hypothetical protein